MPSPSALTALRYPASTGLFRLGAKVYSWEPMSSPWQGFYPFYVYLIILIKAYSEPSQGRPRFYSTSMLTLVFAVQSSLLCQIRKLSLSQADERLWKYLDPVKAVQVKTLSDSNTEEWPDH